MVFLYTPLKRRRLLSLSQQAGFNKHAKEGVPSEKEIEGFLSFAFGKMRDELQREGDKE